jgi:hypothetical protein
MKLKNKYSKQKIYIYINQKFKNQIWYNQQIIVFQKLVFRKQTQSRNIVAF